MQNIAREKNKRVLAVHISNERPIFPGSKLIDLSLPL